MVGELITLPLRVGVRATQLWLRAASGAAGVALNVATQLIDRDRQVARPTTPATPAASSTPATAVRESASPRPAQTRPAEPAETVPPPLEEEPAHVSEEPVLVDEFAEPGAEEGAGAQVRIQEPWEGYQQCSAEDVIKQLAKASSAELAAVQLFESSHRARQTILAAVGRELRRANGSGSPTPERNR